MSQKNLKPRVIFSFPSFESGGAEKASKLYYKSLKSKCDVFWITSSSNDDLSKDVSFKASWISINNFSRKRRLLIHQVKLIKFLFSHSGQTTVISFQGHVLTVPLLRAFSAITRRKVNIIYRESNDVNAYMKKEIKGKFKRLVFKYIIKGLPAVLADHIIVNSQGSRTSFLDLCNVDEKKLICVYNPFFIDNERHQVKSDVKIFDFGFVGRLVDQKQPFHFLEMCLVLKNCGKRFRAVISGDGVLLDSLKEKRDEMGLADIVSVQRYDRNIYHKITTLVLTSAYEGLPNVILEGISSGCEVVSYDCESGPREILPPRNLVQKDRIDELAVRCAETLEAGYKPQVIENFRLDKFRGEEFVNSIMKVLR